MNIDTPNEFSSLENFNMNFVELKYTSGNIPSSKRMSLFSNSYTSRSDVEWMRNHFPALEDIDVTCSFPKIDDFLVEFFTNNPQIKRLRFKPTSETIDTIKHNLKKLKCLELDFGCLELLNEINLLFDSFSINKVPIESLRISDVSDETVEKITKLKLINKLIIHCNVTEASAIMIAEELPNVKELQFHMTALTTENVLPTIIQQAKCLSVLSIWVTDVNQISEQFHNLILNMVKGRCSLSIIGPHIGLTRLDTKTV